MLESDVLHLILAGFRVGSPLRGNPFAVSASSTPHLRSPREDDGCMRHNPNPLHIHIIPYMSEPV